MRDFIPGISYEYWGDVDFWRNIRPYPGAAEQYQRLAAVYDIAYVTHCRYAEPRIEWLDTHGFPPGEFHNLNPTEKVELAKERAFVAAIEDRAETIVELAAVIPEVYCVTQPWNAADFPENVWRPTVDTTSYQECAVSSLDRIVDRILLHREIDEVIGQLVEKALIGAL